MPRTRTHFAATTKCHLELDAFARARRVARSVVSDDAAPVTRPAGIDEIERVGDGAALAPENRHVDGAVQAQEFNFASGELAKSVVVLFKLN